MDTPAGLPDEGVVGRFEFDPNTDDVVVAVVEAVDVLADVSSDETDAVLYDSVDPDALRRCLETGGPATRVSFEFGPYEVTAAARGEVLVSR